MCHSTYKICSVEYILYSCSVARTPLIEQLQFFTAWIKHVGNISLRFWIMLTWLHPIIAADLYTAHPAECSCECSIVPNSKRPSFIFRSGCWGGHWKTLNSLFSWRKKFEMTNALWHDNCVGISHCRMGKLWLERDAHGECIVKYLNWHRGAQCLPRKHFSHQHISHVSTWTVDTKQVGSVDSRCW